MLTVDKILGKLKANQATSALRCVGITDDVLKELVQILFVQIPSEPELDLIYFGPDGREPDPNHSGRVWVVDNSQGFLIVRRFINGKWLDTYPIGYTRWVDGNGATFNEVGWAVADGRAKTVPDLSHQFIKDVNGVATKFIVAFEGYQLLD